MYGKNWWHSAEFDWKFQQPFNVFGFYLFFGEFVVPSTLTLHIPHWPHALCLIIQVWWIWSGVFWKSDLYKIPSSKLTWQWKSTFSNREYIFKWWMFHCYVSLLEGSLRTMFITAFHSKHKSKLIRLSGGVIEKWCQFRFLNACNLGW